jgi:hypothetical protein
MSSTAANGRRPNGAPRGRLELIASAASPEEAAAIVAALERFMRATAPAPRRAADRGEAWRRTAMLEAVGRGDEPDLGHPWINP